MTDLNEYMEAMLYESKTTPTDYKKEYVKNHSVLKIPKLIPVPMGTTLHNPKVEEETGKRKAYRRYPWIKYWQAFAGDYNNKQYCTCCGNEIFVDTTAQDCRMFFNIYYKPEEGASIDDLQAMGGHFYKNLENPNDGYIIAPVCRSCNKFDSAKPLKVVCKNVFVEEYADHIDE